MLVVKLAGLRRLKPSDYLLIRRGRVLTPWSRTRYRWLRLRSGHATFQSVAMSSELDLPVAAVGSGVRILTLPLFALLDLSWWPLARATVARSGWTVVRVDFHGADAEFVRVGHVSTRDEAQRLRREIAAQHHP